MTPSPHENHDQVSLLFARYIADGLPAHPEWVAIARDNLARWSAQNTSAPRLMRSYAEWRAILDRPISEICRQLLAETDEGQRLRQNSPFVGIMSQAQVREIKERVRRGATAA